MELELKIIGDSVLRGKTEKVTVFDEGFAELIKQFTEKMYAWDGIGLAAPQAGIMLRFFVMDDGVKQRFVVNPEILEFLGDPVEMEEGCLSVPGIYADVKRPEGLKVRYQDPQGNVIEEELHEMTARIFQHEYDHLDGILFVDKLSVVQKARIKPELLKLAKEQKKKQKEAAVKK